MGSLSGTNGKQKGKKSGSEERAFRFINYTLSKQDGEWLESADLETEFPLSLVCELATEGYKFSVSFDGKNQCYLASLTDRDEGSPFYNSCLTGRGSTPVDAFHALLYRHLVLSERDWSFFGDTGNRTTGKYG